MARVLEYSARNCTPCDAQEPASEGRPAVGAGPPRPPGANGPLRATPDASDPRAQAAPGRRRRARPRWRANQRAWPGMNETREMEFDHLRRKPTAALLNALRAPSAEYLPSADDFRRNLESAHRTDWYRAVKHAARRRQCECTATDSRATALVLANSKTTGVAKTLKYISELTVRLAATGKCQYVPTNASWLFGAGVSSVGGTHCSGSWGCFFQSNPCEASDGDAVPLGESMLPRPAVPIALSKARHLPNALLTGLHMALALDRWANALQPSAAAVVREMLAAVHETSARPESRCSGLIGSSDGIIGMSVRRADACANERWRTCYPLASYVAAARRLRQIYGHCFATIHLLTDADGVVEEAQSVEYSDFRWRFLAFNRDELFGAGVSSAGSGTLNPYARVPLLEQRLRRWYDGTTNSSLAALTLSMLADLQFVSEAHLFVGTTSHVSEAAMLRMWAKHGVLPPTIWLDGNPPLLEMLHMRGAALRGPASCWRDAQKHGGACGIQDGIQARTPCRTVSFGEAAANRALVPMQQVRRSERYFSLVRCCGRSMLFSRKVWHVAAGDRQSKNSWETVVRRQDGDGGGYGRSEVTFSNESLLTHNAAFFCGDNCTIVGVGGRDKTGMQGRSAKERGLLWVTSPASAWPPMWSTPRRFLSGNHTGCVERRSKYHGVCEFDGRLSAVAHKGAYFVFARANARASSGGRFVQVTQSTDGYTWSPFQRLAFDGGKQITEAGTTQVQEPQGGYRGMKFARFILREVYFFVAKPSGDGRLSGLFPATFEVDGQLKGGVFLSFSHDGINWSSPRQLMESATFDSVRTNDYPFDWERQEDGRLVMRVEHNVQLRPVSEKDQAPGTDMSGNLLPVSARSTPHLCSYSTGASANLG